ncbi:bromodomain-containing protein 2-like [Microplitis mediator]|uniref:bromodomain-containing protein 2-like n=1 Tax=Microplitis mediator TaxID=375433 RepID=UPI002552FF96|nr:bromodomain-containing protein 2-like [Microplitis mediator]
MEPIVPDSQNHATSEVEEASLPREEPHLEPINGEVQPPVLPRPSNPGRVTNQLQFLKKQVLEPLWNHSYAKPFKKPVNTNELRLPDYYKVITNPMDLGTIKKRLANKYYRSADECIEDFNLMFKNCYFYNNPDQDIVLMAQTLEKSFQQKITRMPKKEIEVNRHSGNLGIDQDRFSVSESPRRSTDVETCVKKEADSSNAVNVKTLAEESGIQTEHSQTSKPKVELSAGLMRCRKILKKLYRKRYSEYAWPFYKPLNPEHWGFNDYSNKIKKPMDLFTIKQKLDSGTYANTREFAEDVRLIFTNCYRYNCRKHGLVSMAQRLQHVFEIMYAKVHTSKLNNAEANNSISDSSRSSSSDESLLENQKTIL